MVAETPVNACSVKARLGVTPDRYPQDPRVLNDDNLRTAKHHPAQQERQEPGWKRSYDQTWP